jgi:hypothetical protein
VLVRRDPKTGEVFSVRIDFDPVNDADYYDEDDSDDDGVPE